MPTTTVCFTIADRKGFLIQKVADFLPQILSLFNGAAALVTSQTHQEVVSILDGLGVTMAREPSNVNHIGRHRRISLETGLKTSDSTHFLYIDIDHLLRWFENDVTELGKVIENLGSAELTVIGRSREAFDALPKRLVATESIINHIFALATGVNWDLLMAARGMSRHAAQLIIEFSNVDHIGNDLEWPLLCRSRGLNLAYVAANGLTYKTGKDYALDKNDDKDSDPEAWAIRVEIAALHVSAMRPYIGKGI